MMLRPGSSSWNTSGWTDFTWARGLLLDRDLPLVDLSLVTVEVGVLGETLPTDIAGELDAGVAGLHVNFEVALLPKLHTARLTLQRLAAFVDQDNVPCQGIGAGEALPAVLMRTTMADIRVGGPDVAGEIAVAAGCLLSTLYSTLYCLLYCPLPTVYCHSFNHPGSQVSAAS